MRTIAEIVQADLCIGCGLCEALTGRRVSMALTTAGSLRPMPVDGFTDTEEGIAVSACPGVVSEARPFDAPRSDPVWGRYRSLAMAWAGDPDVRYRSSTGGVLTALACHALASELVSFVLHVGPDPDRPAHSSSILSESPAEVLANAGSRYGPTAPLARLADALDRDEPFAVIAKPCDLGVIHRLSHTDPRVDRRCVLRLAMVCGGQSRFSKTAELLDRFGVTEDEVTELRYRGHGNPGPTFVRTADGATHETTYLDMWADEAGWDLETRCKLCPDALGACADIAAADVWPGGAPTGEDDGFNAMVVRSEVGASLVEDAVDAGALVVGEPLTTAHLDDVQPHQVRKKEALRDRYDGMTDAGVDPIETRGLSIDELGTRFTGDRSAERAGTARRLRGLDALGDPVAVDDIIPSTPR